MTATPIPTARAAANQPSAAAPVTCLLCDLPRHAVATVVELIGDADAQARLAAAGLWPGAEVECLGRAPFGDPVLFWLHGYRLALRRVEAAGVLVARAAGSSQ